MARPVIDIREAIPEIGRVLRDVLATQPAPTPAKQKAIRAVWSAVDNTRMTLRRIKDGELKAGAPSAELVALWSDASLQIAELNGDLAFRLRDKADYWSDPERWDDQKLDEAGIRIDAIAADARALLQVAVPTPQTQPHHSQEQADVFISHASEDKATVAKPLAEALSARGRAVWLDQFELALGDDLMAEVDRGLAGCLFGAVVLSKTFIAKNWPRRELAGLFALETSDGRKRILPIRHEMTSGDVTAFSPLLGGRLSVSTENGIPAVADAIDAAIRKQSA